MSLFQSLKHRPFALLWTGQMLSSLGDSIYRIALAWWILDKTGSATAMGTVFVFSSVPMLLFLLVGGVTVDRYSRPKVMLTSDVLRGALVCAVTALAFAGRLEIWHLYVAALTFGAVAAFFRPAYTAIIPQITPPEHLPSANGLTSLSMQVAEIGGPALGGLVVGAGGIPLAFGLNAATFFVSALCILPLVRLSAAKMKATTERKSVTEDLREGFGVVRRSSWLTITMLISSLASITMSAPFAIALPVLVRKQLAGGIFSFGLLLSIIAAGSIAGTIAGTSVLERVRGLRARGMLAYGLWIAGGLLILVFGLPVNIYAIAAASFLVGVVFAVPYLIFVTTLQELIPGELLGRVSSIATLGSFALIPVGSGLVGWATDRIGASNIFILAGILTAGVAALALLHPSIRHLDEEQFGKMKGKAEG
jgi:DHA3 family tetracycline resistance protein-like MFS transporter